MSRVRLAIGTASTGNVRIEYMESVMEMSRALLNDPALKVDAIKLLYWCSSVIPQNRTNVAKMAQKWGATHLLWIDDDMRFPPVAAKALLTEMKRNKLSILGANCIKRKYPIEWMATGLDGNEVVSTGKTGLEQVAYTGNAFVLMDMKVFNAVEEPWFAFAYSPVTQSFGTEDSYFMIKAANAGFPTWVDHDVSQLIDHIGYHTFKPQDAEVKHDRPD